MNADTETVQWRPSNLVVKNFCEKSTYFTIVFANADGSNPNCNQKLLLADQKNIFKSLTIICKIQ